MRYAIICPGRGSYTEASLGSLNVVHQQGGDGATFIDAVEVWRAEYKLPGLLELDAAERFSASRHLRPANVSVLIWLSTMLDCLAVQAERKNDELVAVAGNSMGWYTGLAVAGGLSHQDGFHLVQEMSLMQESQRGGGQLLYPICDRDWRLDPARLEAVENAVATSHDQAFDSIELGGFRVLAGSDTGMAHLMKSLPPIAAGEHGRAAYPLKLAMHGPYHSRLLSDVAFRAQGRLKDLGWRKPNTSLVDGRGSMFTPWSANPRELMNYTLGHQVTRPFDFTRSVRVMLREFAPEQLVLPGPGNTLGGICGQTLSFEGWRGIHSRADFDVVQQSENPIIISMQR